MRTPKEEWAYQSVELGRIFDRDFRNGILDAMTMTVNDKDQSPAYCDGWKFAYNELMPKITNTVKQYIEDRGATVPKDRP